MSSSMIRWCGWAAAVGGAMWAAKGLAILVTGSQPPLLFEVPLLLFPVGLLGLHARLRGQTGRLLAAGGVVSAIALVAGAAAVVMLTIDPDADGVVPGVAIAGSALGTVAGLVLLGLVARRAEIFRPPWHRLPLLIGLSIPILLTVVGGALAAIDERLLEVPLVLVAAAWVRLGVLIAAVDRAGGSNGEPTLSRRGTPSPWFSRPGK